MKCTMFGKLSLTFSSAILIPRLNLPCTSKLEMVLVNLTFTVGLVTTVTWLSIMMVKTRRKKDTSPNGTEVNTECAYIDTYSKRGISVQ